MSGVGIGISPVFGAVAPFTPTALSGLDLWLKADGTLWQDSGRTTPVAANNDLVGAQDDASGGSKHGLQTDNGLRPTYKTNIQNGKPGLLYSFGTGTFLLSTSAAAQEPVTLIAVVQLADFSRPQTIFGASANGGLQFRANITTGRPSLLAQDTAAIGTATSGITAGQTAIVAATYAANGAFEFFLNGVSDGSGTNDQALTAGSTRIGADRDNNEYLGGYLFEQLKYTSVLSAANLAAVFAYLNSRWAVY